METPRAATVQINRAISSVLANPEVQARVRAQDNEPLGGSAVDFDRFIRSEIQRWLPMVKRLGLKME